MTWLGTCCVLMMVAAAASIWHHWGGGGAPTLAAITVTTPANASSTPAFASLPHGVEQLQSAAGNGLYCHRPDSQ